MMLAALDQRAKRREECQPRDAQPVGPQSPLAGLVHERLAHVEENCLDLHRETILDRTCMIRRGSPHGLAVDGSAVFCFLLRNSSIRGTLVLTALRPGAKARSWRASGDGL